MTGLILALLVAFDRPRFRSSERFTVNKPAAFSTVSVDEHKCELIDVSDTGARIRLPYTADSDMYYHVDGLIIDAVGTGPGDVDDEGRGRIEIGLHFKEMDKELYVKLIGFMFNEENAKKADREKRADTLSTVIRFLTKTEKSPDASREKYVREAFQGLGTLLFPRDSEKGAHEVMIKDISLSGCQIEIRLPA